MLQKGGLLKVKLAVKKHLCHFCKALDEISVMCHVSPQMVFSLVEWLAFFLSKLLVSLDMDGCGLGYLSYQSSMKCT